MSSKTVKGLTVEIGGDTSKLGTAIKNAEDKSKSLGRELTDVNKLLKLDPENVDLLAQKQQILTERVASTKDKLDILKEAEASVQAQFEKNEITAEQYRAFQREIAYTKNEMEGYEKAVEKISRQLTEAKLKTGEEANSLEELRTKISLQEQGLSDLTEQYKSAVIAEGEDSEAAKELKEKYNQLNTELSESRQKMTDAEAAAASLGRAEETILSPIESLKKTISEQEKELSSLKDEYKNVVMEQGKDSDAAKQLESQFNSLNQELQDNRQKLNDVEQEANQLGQAEENALSPMESLKKTISEQEKELDRLNAEYQNAVLQYGKNSDEARSLASQIKNLSEEHKAQKNRLEESEKAAKDVTAAEQTLTEHYKEQKSELDSLKKQYVNAAAQYGANSREARMLAAQIEVLSGELAEEDKKIKEAEKSADSFDNTLDDAAKSADEASDDVEELGKSAEKSESGFKAAASAASDFMKNLAVDLLQKATSLMAGFASETVQTGQGFEASMSNVTAISGKVSDEDLPGIIQKAEEMGLSFEEGSNATETAMNIISAKAREMGRETQYSASEAADALGYMALAGWDTEKMISGLPGVLNLAAASQMDLAQASDIVTDYMTAFGWEAERAGDFADRMAYAMANSNTDTQMLGEAYKNCASTANSLGYEMEDVTAVIMTMANAGVKGGEAGTAMNAVMTRLATDTKGCASALAEFGVNIYDEKGNMNDLSGILEGLSGVWENLTDQEQANLAKQIAGQNQYAAFQTIMQGLSDKAKEGGQSFSDYAEALRTCNGTAEEMAGTMTDNLQGDLKILESAYQDLQLSVYDNVNTPLRTVVQTISGELLPAVSNLVNGVDGADSEISSAVSKLVSQVLEEISALLPKFAGILGSLTLTLIENLPELANAVQKALENLVEIILDALPDALDAVLQTVDTLLSGLADLIPKLISAAVALVKTLAAEIIKYLPLFTETALEIITALAEGLLQALPELLSMLPELVQKLADGLLQSIDMIVETGFTLLTAVIDALPDVITKILEVLPVLITSIVGGLLERVPEIIEAGITLLTALVDALPEIIEGITAVLPEIMTAIIDVVIDNLPLIVDAGFQLFMALADALPEIIGELVVQAAFLVESIVLALSQKLPEMAEAGADLFLSLREKSKEILAKIISLVPEIITGITGKIIESFDKLSETGVEMWNSIWDGWSDMLLDAETWGADIIENLVNGIFSGKKILEDAVGNIAESIKSFLHFSVPDKGPLTDFESWMPDFMHGLASGIGENTALVTEQIASLSDTMTEQAKNIGNSFLTGIQSFIDRLPEIFKNPLNSVIENVENFYNLILDTAKNIGNGFLTGIQNFIRMLPDEVQKHLTAVLNHVVEWGRDLKQKALSAASGMVSTIENTVRVLPDRMWSIGQNLVQGLWNGIQSMRNWLYSVVQNFCDNLISNIMNAFEIHSPSKKMAYAGQMIDAGLAEGMEDYSDYPFDTMKKIASELMNEVPVIPERMKIQNSYIQEAQPAGLESALSAQLGEILNAIKAGQVLVLDGNQIVGGTADRMNQALGQIQAISVRR